jgi:hypothetical protein
MKVQQKLIAKKKLKDNYPISNDLVIVQLISVQSRANHFCDTELVASSLDVFRNQKYTPIQFLAVGTGSIWLIYYSKEVKLKNYLIDKKF